jgi:hypothetical protein
MRKDGWAYWTTGLPYDSDALEDLQRLADELGVTKAEANRLLLIAYSKSTRGTWSQLWGFGPGAVVFSPSLVESSIDQNGKAEIANIEERHRRRRSAAAAAAIAFDLDD